MIKRVLTSAAVAVAVAGAASASSTSLDEIGSLAGAPSTADATYEYVFGDFSSVDFSGDTFFEGPLTLSTIFFGVTIPLDTETDSDGSGDVDGAFFEVSKTGWAPGEMQFLIDPVAGLFDFGAVLFIQSDDFGTGNPFDAVASAGEFSSFEAFVVVDELTATVIPLPAGLVLMLSALGAVGVLRRLA